MPDAINSIAETIKTLKQFSRGLGEVAHALNTPLPARPCVISYEDSTIDQTTGRCWYKDKEYRLEKGGIIYILLNLLVVRMGNPVTYQEIFQAIREVKGTETKITKEMVSSSVRELRRKFGINSKKNPEDDIFLATGNGYRLIPR